MNEKPLSYGTLAAVIAVMTDYGIHQGDPLCCRMQALLPILKGIDKMNRCPAKPLFCMERPTVQELFSFIGSRSETSPLFLLDSLFTGTTVPVPFPVENGDFPVWENSPVFHLMDWILEITGADAYELVGKANDWWVWCIEMPRTYLDTAPTLDPSAIGVHYFDGAYKIKLGTRKSICDNPDITVRIDNQPPKKERRSTTQG